ncbi:hypothetical protein [Sphingomonas bacterium]|uniref:hypothetical protein n=1 Tax=Sphingomonas bacterium TaxID=1895847 RepID=UPI001575F32F|nr:hypothetical protein [Sphingomonas bacterium]
MAESWINEALEGLIEELAAIEHGRWSRWQRYMHGKSQQAEDGSLVVPADLAERWARQMRTEYHSLEEAERESDREQVREYLPIIAAALKAADAKRRDASSPVGEP